MVLHRTLLSCVLRAFLIGAATHFVVAAQAGNPYEGISRRNVFHLVAPLPPHTQSPPAPLPKIRLTGITTILRGKRALLKVQFATKPFARPTTEESFILKEGERAGPIQVLQINEKTSQVTVDDSGVVTNLTFEKLPPTPAPALPMARSLVRGRPYGSPYR